MVSIEELDDDENITYYPTMNHLLALNEMRGNWTKVFTTLKMYYDYDLDIDPLMEHVTKIYFLNAREEPESVKYDSEPDSDFYSDWDDSEY